MLNKLYFRKNLGNDSIINVIMNYHRYCHGIDLNT